jgi:hypothetical protein
MTNLADTLWTPTREQVVTTNAWAFLHWLEATRGLLLDGWDALHRYSASEPVAFRAAIAAFARLPETPSRILRHTGEREALVLRAADGSRQAFSRDALAASATGLPTDMATAIIRPWPRASLARALADLLLYQDIRPDDRVLLAASPSWPALAMLLEGTTVIFYAGRPDRLLAAAAEEQATVFVAPASWMADLSFQRTVPRPDLRALRSIVLTGGPLAPEARIRVSTWIKPNLMLLARAGDTIWGNPLEPVLAKPRSSPALFAPLRQPTSEPDPP